MLPGIVIALLLCCHGVSAAISIGTTLPNVPLPLPLQWDNTTLATSAVIDANWRWLNGDKLEGQGDATAMRQTYGVSAEGNALTLRYVTVNPYGTNVGSRLYLLAANKQTYQGFNLLHREFSFDILFNLPCGLNAAVYFSEMPADGGLAAAYGTGYYDAQCAEDLKLNGAELNSQRFGMCGVEMDIFEGNQYASAFTPHNCKQSPYVCKDDLNCGRGSHRYSGTCDKDGADYNMYRAGRTNEYGPGLTLDTTKKFTLHTRFHAPTGVLERIERLFTQNGKTWSVFNMTDATIAAQKTKFGETNHHQSLGGLKAMGEAFARGKMTLVMSLWDDTFAQMAWLDGVYPPGSTAPGAKRGPCPPTNAMQLRQSVPDSYVTYSNLRVRSLGAPAAPSPTPSPNPPKQGEPWLCHCIKQ